MGSDVEVGYVTIKRVDGRPVITRADRRIYVATDLVNRLRAEPTEWARVDDETLTVRDDRVAYTYRIAPLAPEYYGGELISEVRET